MKSRINNFFDYASATPLDEGVLSLMSPYFTDEFYNASALYFASDPSRDAMRLSRESVADTLGVKQQEVIFTSGCTEANNLAIQGIMDQHPGSKVLVSTIEHESVREPATKYPCSEIPVDSNGIINLSALEKLITDDVVLISVVYMSNILGTIQPVRKIAEIVAKIRINRGIKGPSIYLHTDAAQAPNTLPITRSSLRADLISLNGGKIYGPKGSGCLITSKDTTLTPLILGGGQETGLRSGTENIPAIVGFAEALKQASNTHKQEAVRLSSLVNYLQTGLKALGCTIFADESDQTSIFSVLVPGQDNETLVYKMSQKGFSISAGSACHAKKSSKSHALSAIGVSDAQSMSTIRLSLGRHSTEESVTGLLQTLASVLD